jgi:choline kinase
MPHWGPASYLWRCGVNTRPDTAVILAAGRGARMNELGKERPKGFVRIGELPIVEESVIRLLIAGIRRVVIVTGHLAEHYVQLAMRYQNIIALVHNPDFYASGSMHSLCLAQQQVRGDFVLLDSDIIYEQRALTKTLADPAANVMLVSGITGSGDEVYVEARDGMLQRMSKRRDQLGDDILGEMVGIAKISQTLFEGMIRFAQKEGRQPIRIEYEHALASAAAKTPVCCRLVNDLIWSEIDNSDHLLRASTHVYPAIIDRDGPLNYRSQQ